MTNLILILGIIACIIILTYDDHNDDNDNHKNGNGNKISIDDIIEFNFLNKEQKN